MKLKIYYSDTTLDITIKDIYTEEQIIEALQTDTVLTVTKEDGNAIIINLINVVAIEICKGE